MTPPTRGKASRNASEYKGAVFFYEGGVDKDGRFIEKGEFVVKCVSANDNFSCTRVGGEAEELFDMQYAIERIRKYQNA